LAYYLVFVIAHKVCVWYGCVVLLFYEHQHLYQNNIFHYFSDVGIFVCCVINIDAAPPKVLPIDRPLKTGQLTVLWVYEDYCWRSKRWLISLITISMRFLILY